MVSEDRNLMNVRAAAAFLGVHPNTIRRWAQASTLHGKRVGTRGDWRFTREDLLAMLHSGDAHERPPTAIHMHLSPSKRRALQHRKHFQDEDFLLQTERQRLYELFMQAPAGIAILRGSDYRIDLANEIALRIWRKSASVINKPLFKAMPELRGQGLEELLDGVYQTGIPYIGQAVKVLFDKGDGTVEETDLTFVYTPLRNAENEIEGIMAFGYEVTEQVKARQRVEEQNRVLEMITSGAPLSDALEFLVHSIEKQSANEMKGSLLLLDADGQHLRHGAGPSLPKEYNEAIDGIAVGPSVGSCGTAAYRKESVIVSDIATDPLWIDFKDLAHQHGLRSCWSTPIFSPEQRVLGTFAMYYHEPRTPSREDRQIIDFATRTAALVIERRNTEEKLQENMERFRTLAENIQNLAWMANPDGWLFWYNQRWYEYTGTTLEEMQGWGWEKVHHPDHRDRVVAFVKEAWQKSEPWELTFPLRGHDGQYRWFLTRAIPVRDTGGNVVRWVGTNTDITEQRTVEQQKDQFIGIASHELKTPVTSIKGYTQLLKRRFRNAGDDRASEMLGKLEAQVDKLTGLIEDLLDATRIESENLLFQPSLFDLNALISEVVGEIQQTATKHIIVQDLAPPVTLAADRDRIGQVLTNLLTNAIKYSPQADRVVVRTECREGSVVTAVQDFGIGIPVAMQPHVFERFYRVDGETRTTYPGLGLGLFIAAEFVKRHHGDIWVESEEGQGTTVAFSLPLEKA